MANIKLVEDLSNAFGPSGFEEDVVEVVKKNMQEFSLESDAMHNVFAKLQNNTGKKPVVMLDAHLDEVGFMVQAVQENGLLSMVMLGGFHMTNIPAHSVIVRTQDGRKYKGITTSKPVHFLTAAEKADNTLEIEKVFIDVGASSREEIIRDFGIEAGDPVMLDTQFEYHEENGICYGKAFDNRLGCACIVETMKGLAQENNLNVDVVGAFAAQEEVGVRGATVTAQVVEPDFAIVFEGSPADDTFFSPNLAQGALKKGVQIRHLDIGYIANPSFIRYAKGIADEKGITYQSAVRRGGSTDASKISLTGKAVPCLVLGIPTRYAHSHYNFCAEFDIDATVQLAIETIKNLTPQAMDTILHKN